MIGILLAGGASRRFGSPKAFARKDDVCFYEIAYNLLHSVCEEVVIVSSEKLFHQFPQNLHVILDEEEFRGKGPLAGIYSVIKQIQANKYMVLPCDMPFLTTEIIQQLAKVKQSGQIIAIQSEQKVHPLVSVWYAELLPELEKYLKADRCSVMKFLATVDTKWVDANDLSDHPESHFQNINEPFADYKDF